MEDDAGAWTSAESLINTLIPADRHSELARDMAKAATRKSMDLINVNSESPIEAMLFRGLLIGMLSRCEFLKITNPEGDLWRVLWRFPRNSKSLSYKLSGLNPNIWHLSLQPKLEIDGLGNIRPDAIAWSKDAFCAGVVIECDGYEFHSSKESFISDRKRDRALQDYGFQVRRYSGSEIVADPLGVGIELAGRLLDLSGDTTRAHGLV